ncbi:MAG: hypothetical protein ACI97A_003581 [Planctomycetota bacterium]
MRHFLNTDNHILRRIKKAIRLTTRSSAEAMINHEKLASANFGEIAAFFGEKTTLKRPIRGFAFGTWAARDAADATMSITKILSDRFVLSEPPSSVGHD